VEAAGGRGEVSERVPKTKYGFPDLIDPFTPFPEEAPWDVPLAKLAGWWLEIECSDHFETGMPLRLLAANAGWTKTLRQVVPLLKCHSCGKPPVRVDFVSDLGGEGGRHGAAVHRHHLAGEDRRKGV
jgi:hypothetical protein